jgi:nitrogen regulatory protein PII
MRVQGDKADDAAAVRSCQGRNRKGLTMKYIVAIIQPGKLDAVHQALLDIGVTGLTVTEVQGYGRQKGKSEIYRGAEYVVHFLPKVKIEVAVPTKLAAKLVETIKTVSGSGKIGDGKIFTFDLADALRIRTGETGQAAL